MRKEEVTELSLLHLRWTACLICARLGQVNNPWIIMNLKLEDKAALVTGSTAGIGFAIALGLAREGVPGLLSMDEPRHGLTLRSPASANRCPRQRWTASRPNVTWKEL
jgi:hypothetical protein